MYIYIYIKYMRIDDQSCPIGCMMCMSHVSSGFPFDHGRVPCPTLGCRGGHCQWSQWLIGLVKSPFSGVIPISPIYK